MRRGFEEFAFERAAVDFEAHRVEQVALRDRGDRRRDFLGRPDQIVDQRVDRGLHLAPGAAREAEFHAMTGLALAPDQLADALELLGHALIGCNDVIESIRDLAEEAVFLAGHPHGKVAGPHCAQRLQKILQFQR